MIRQPPSGSVTSPQPLTRAPPRRQSLVVMVARTFSPCHQLVGPVFDSCDKSTIDRSQDSQTAGVLVNRDVRQSTTTWPADEDVWALLASGFVAISIAFCDNRLRMTGQSRLATSCRGRLVLQFIRIDSMNLQVRAIVVALAIIVLCGCTQNPSTTTGRLPSATQQTDVTVVPQQHPPETTEFSSLHTVDRYDPDASPGADLAKTVSLASASGKRIILEIGGEW